MSAGSGARRTLCLLAIFVTMTCESPASPIVADIDAPEPRAPRETALAAEDGWQPDRSDVAGGRWAPSPRRDDARIDRSAFASRSATGSFTELALEATAAPGDGADAAIQRNSALIALMRDFGNPLASPAAGSGPGRASAPHVMTWEAVENVLRMVRDSLMDDNDSANFSLAGVEFSVTLRSDRRSLALNGQEWLAASPGGVQGDEGWRSPGYTQGVYYSGMPAATAQGAAGQKDYARATAPMISLAKIRDFLTHPLTLTAAFLTVGLWVFLKVFRSARERQRW